MSVPKTLLREEEELNAFLQEEQARESAPEEHEASQGVEEAAASEPVVKEQETAPEPQPVKETPAPKSDTDLLRAELDKLNHKFSVLQGKYNSETRQLRDTLRARDMEIEELKSRPETAPAMEQHSDWTRYDIPEEEYDEDVVRLAERVADAKTRDAMKAVQAKLDEARRATEYQAEEKFFSDLSRVVDNWEEVNVSEDWLNWLGTVDRRTGRPLQELLDDAVAQRDVLRTAAFFEEYSDFQSGRPPVAQRTPSVSSQVVPRSSASTPAPKKNTMSFDEWQAKADALSKGRHSADSFLKLEAELDAAIREGRVTM